MKIWLAALGILSLSVVATLLAFNQFVWNEGPANSSTPTQHGQTLEIPHYRRQDRGNPLLSAAADDEGVPVEASAFVGPNYAANNPLQEFWFTVQVLNRSSEAIEYLDVFAELRSPGRSVPVESCQNIVRVPAGIEPGETRSVKFNFCIEQLGFNRHIAPETLPERTFLAVRIGDTTCKASYLGYKWPDINVPAYELP